MNRSTNSSNAAVAAGRQVLSDKRQRAVRKELLLARAALQRLEITQARAEIKHSVKGIGLAKIALPLLSRRKKAGEPRLFNRYPLLGLLMSLIATRRRAQVQPKPVHPRKTRCNGVMRRARTVARIGAGLLAVFEGYRMWRRKRTVTVTSQPPLVRNRP
jgi:hypothetical protein